MPSALNANGFTHVLCVTSGATKKPLEGITRVLLPLSDHGESDIMDEVVPLAVPFIEDALAQPESKVLVHCSQGINRSVTVVVSYFMAAKRMTLRDAWSLVSQRRPQACMHDRYVAQLRSYDLQLFGTHSTAEDEIITTSAALKAVMATYAEA